MKPDNAIEAAGIGKKFKVYYDKGSSLKERVLFQRRRRYEEHWVLKDVSFEVKKGEAVGLIGKNGCGKSTVLKMLAHIMYPTKGKISLQGRVSSLIELGAGFHPDMSGRENIFMNASIFGLNHAQIERRIDTIVRFSELEEFIDNPVRTYSSGMYMRLAFAVAIHVDADILLIDEILAVGDVNFQSKCFERLKEIKANGTTIVIVSHVTGQIQEICDRVLWIEDGLVREEGRADQVVQSYLEEMERKRREKIRSEFKQEIVKRQAGRLDGQSLPDCCIKEAVREGSMEVHFTYAAIHNTEGKQEIFFQPGEQMEICLGYCAKQPGEKINFSINITRDDGVHCFGTSALSGMRGRPEISAKKQGRASMVITCSHLLQGRYFVDVGIQDMQENKYDYIRNALEFRIEDPHHASRGIVNLPVYWNVDGERMHITENLKESGG